MRRAGEFAFGTILVVLSFAALSAPVDAQTTTGGITGVVQDAGGGVLPGVTVKATHEATNAETTAVSNEVGIYVLRGLPVGRYIVVAELSGFQTSKNTDVVVRVNEDVRLDIGLKVGAVSEMVTVSGMASTVDTVTGTLKTVVDQERIENLPLNGRNPTQLMTLVAGVLTDRSDLTSGATYPGTSPVSSSGARGNTTNYVLDGGSNNDHYSNGPNPMPNPDALQEFSVQTNSFSAEYGRNVGAIVNAVTRAGTNQYHGLGFGYFRHYKFNATNFFTPGVDDGLERQQYGGTFGGPIVKNRTFFFGSYQGTNQSTRPTQRQGLVPSAAMRNGDFSAIPRALRNPFTGQPFPGNQVPTSLFAPSAVKIVNEWLPLPNPVGNDNPLTLRFPQPSESDDHQYLGRVDHTFTNNHRMYGRFWVSRASQPPVLEDGNILSSAFGRTWQNTVASVNDTYLIGQNLLEQPGRDVQPDEQLQLPDLSPRLLDARHQRLQRRDAAVVLQRGRLFRHQQRRHEHVPPRTSCRSWTRVRWTKGRHEIATGIDYSYGQGDIVNNFRANGRYSYSNAAPFSGDALVDFYLGKFSSFEQAIGEYKNTRMHFLATFIQDTFRVNRQLTLNLGLRWDPFFPYTDVNNRLGCYRPGERVAGLHERTGRQRSTRAIRPALTVDTVRRGPTSARASALPTIRSATARAASAPVTGFTTTGRTRFRPTVRRTRDRSARWSRSRVTRSTTSRTRTPAGRIRSRPIRSTSRRTCSSSCRTPRSATTRISRTAASSRGTQRSSARSSRPISCASATPDRRAIDWRWAVS